MNWLRDWMLPSQHSAFARDYDFFYMSLVWLSVRRYHLVCALAMVPFTRSIAEIVRRCPITPANHS